MCSPGVTARDRVLAELAAAGPGVTDAVTLVGLVRDLAGFADQVQGELARLAAALDAVDGAAEAGYSSTAAFLRHGCGRSPGRAGELVATGRALRRLEATGKALAAGEISFDAAHVIGRAAAQNDDDAMAAAAEEQMLAFARNPPPEPAGPAAAADAPDAADAADGNAGPDTAGPAGPTGPDPAAMGLGAPALDPTQLRVLGEELIYRADPDGVEERERKRFERRHLSFGVTLENTGTIAGACGDSLSVEIIKTAVHAFGPPLGAEDTRTAAQRRMDGLTAACQAALDSGKAGTRHGAAPHLSILVEEQTLAGASGTAAAPGPATGGPSGTGPSAPGSSAPGSSGTGSSGTGPSGAGPSGAGPAGAGSTGSGLSGNAPVGSGPAEAGRPGTGSPATPCGTPPLPGPPPARTGYGALLTARQVLALACHADLSVIRWRDGIPLDVGRRYRTETPALRRALEARDRGCRFPGCTMPAAWSTAHHLRPWSKGGATSLANTALFCFVHHHVFIHLYGWAITGNSNATLHFTHPTGAQTLHSPLPS